MGMRLLFACVLTITVGSGCPAAPEVEGVDGDGGTDAGTDAGEEYSQLADTDGEDIFFPGCEDLVERTCGVDDKCTQSAACQAALLMSDHRPDRCEEALADTYVYPTCEEGACTRLVEKTCGSVGDDAACAAAPGCALSQQLLQRADDESLSSEERQEADVSCAAGLEDETVFPACG